MKPTVLGLAIAAAAFGASTVYLSLQLREERVQSDKLTAETRALNSRIAELEKAQSERRFGAVNPFGPGMSPRGPRLGHPVRIEETSETGGDVVEGVAFNPPPRNQEFFDKMMRSQLRASNKQLYADIAAKLGLNKEEANKLIDLLTEQQLQGFTAVGNTGRIEESFRLLEEKQRQDKAKIAELIGADKAEALEEYQQSLPARQELDMLARQFDGADAPLSAEQQKRLLAILVEERKRVPAPKMTDATTIEEYSKAYTDWQGNYDESVASQARAILNQEQLATYNEYHEWQQQMRSQVGSMPAGRVQRIPGGPNVMFATAGTAMSADVAIAAPAAEKPRK